MDSNLAQLHVLILGDGSAFDKGVKRLLTHGHGTNLLVSHAIFNDDLAYLNIIKTDNRPDVIVVNESGLLYTAHILDLLSSHPAVRELRIIVVRLYKNVIDIYERPVFVAGKMVFWPRRSVVMTEGELLNAVSKNHTSLLPYIDNIAHFLLTMRLSWLFERSYSNTRFVENMKDGQDREPLHTNMKENTYKEMS